MCFMYENEGILGISECFTKLVFSLYIYRLYNYNIYKNIYTHNVSLISTQSAFWTLLLFYFLKSPRFLFLLTFTLQTLLNSEQPTVLRPLLLSLLSFFVWHAIFLFFCSTNTNYTHRTLPPLLGFNFKFNS